MGIKKNGSMLFSLLAHRSSAILGKAVSGANTFALSALILVYLVFPRTFSTSVIKVSMTGQPT